MNKSDIYVLKKGIVTIVMMLMTMVAILLLLGSYFDYEIADYYWHIRFGIQAGLGLTVGCLAFHILRVLYTKILNKKKQG